MTNTDLVVATRQIHQEIHSREDEFRCALPDHIPVSKFRRVLMTAISKDPDLLAADRVSLFQAAMDCAQDGLLPDGREAALVVFKTKVKRGGVEVYIKAVTYMPMVRGILKRMRNTGLVTAPTAQLVYSKDHFKYWVDDDGQHLMHEFDVFADRGEIVGVYARAKTTDGEVHLEVMSRAEVEYIRHTFSRQPNGQMWTKSWGEGARKTVLRRLAKVLPASTDLDVMMDRGDGILPDVKTAPPRPSLADFQEPASKEPEDEPELLEGELYRAQDPYGCIEYEGGDQKLALASLQTMLDRATDDAEREHIREANPDLVGLLSSPSGNGEDTPSATSSPAAPAAESVRPLADQQPAGTTTPLWNAASRRKIPGNAIFGLGNVTSPRHTRYFTSVAAWCAALCELADATNDDDAMALWETNLTVHTQLCRDFQTDVEQQHLKAAADHFRAIHKAMQGITP